MRNTSTNLRSPICSTIDDVCMYKLNQQTQTTIFQMLQSILIAFPAHPKQPPSWRYLIVLKEILNNNSRSQRKHHTSKTHSNLPEDETRTYLNSQSSSIIDSSFNALPEIFQHFTTPYCLQKIIGKFTCICLEL